MIADAAVLVVQNEIPPSATERAVEIAVAHGTRVIVNPAPIGPLATSVLLAADPLVVNEHEAAAALSALSPQYRALNDRSPLVDHARRLAVALRAQGVASVIVTLGSHGALGVSGLEDLWQEAPRQVTAVDTTGAGDAFIGALAADLASGRSLRHAVSHANRVAGYSVQHPGTQRSYPTIDKELP